MMGPDSVTDRNASLKTIAKEKMPTLPQSHWIIAKKKKMGDARTAEDSRAAVDHTGPIATAPGIRKM